MERIDRGGELPDRDSILYKRFVNSWREWFRVYSGVKGDFPKEVIARNKYYYDIGKEHIESLGGQVTDNNDYNKETGTVQVYFPKKFGLVDDDEATRAFSYEVEV